GEEALGGVVHQDVVGVDADGEGAGGVDADVVLGEGALEGDVDDQGLQGHVGVVVDQGADEGAAAVEALGGAVAADPAVDDADAGAGGEGFAAAGAPGGGVVDPLALADGEADLALAGLGGRDGDVDVALGPQGRGQRDVAAGLEVGHGLEEDGQEPDHGGAAQ